MTDRTRAQKVAGKISCVSMLLIVLVVARSLKKTWKTNWRVSVSVPIRSTCCFRCLCTQLPVIRWCWFFLFQLIGGLARGIAASEVLTGELDPNDKSRTTGRNQASHNHRCELQSDVKILWLFVRHLRLRKGVCVDARLKKMLHLKILGCFRCSHVFLKMFVSQENVLLQKLPRPQQCESLDHLVVRLLPLFLHIGKYTMLPTTLEILKSIKVWLCHWVYELNSDSFMSLDYIEILTITCMPCGMM